MDSNRIKNVALGARDALMADVEASLDRVLAADSPERVADALAVARIEEAIQARGREEVVEQVAYTWFNRLCALRYMDVRGYTPVGLVSPRPGETLPAVLADARRGVYAQELGITSAERTAVDDVIAGRVTSHDALGQAYVMLLVAACKAYEKSMGFLFGSGRGLGKAVGLLAPTDLLSEGSLLHKICEGLDEETCREGVEVMGWLYQFYVSERKDAFFASKKKAQAADIAPATQLFTPNWIVRYLVENSLGRLWMLNYPESTLAEHMDYYIQPDAAQKCHPERSGAEGGAESKDLVLEEDFLKLYAPEDITFLDPACGSGHILVYAFDLLYLMYEEEGYRPADIPALILQHNLTGIEIDDRAAEIAAFCLEMKALERDSDFLNKNVDAHVVVTHKLDLTPGERRLAPELCADAALMEAAGHLDELGSLFTPTEEQLTLVRQARADVADDGSIDAANLRAKLDDLQAALGALATCYAVVAANPPYMGSSNMNVWMNSWVKDHYPDEKGDLCTCFIERGFHFAASHGYSSMITMQSWMFLGSYEKMREKLLRGKTILSMNHLGTRAFEAIGGEVVSTTATTFWNARAEGLQGSYVRLVDVDNAAEKAEKFREAVANPACGWFYRCDAAGFNDIPVTPIAYWLKPCLIAHFRCDKPVGDYIEAREGLTTADNDLFLRLWQEVSRAEIVMNASSSEDTFAENAIWFPYTKGGEFRRWYGNNDYVVNWHNDGERIRQNVDLRTGRVRSHNYNGEYAFKEGFSWSSISSDSFAGRYCSAHFMFDTKGPMAFSTTGDLLPVLSFLHSSTAEEFIRCFSPKLDFKLGAILAIPLSRQVWDEADTIRELANINVDLVRIDWDSFETSWDFQQHPLVRTTRVADAYALWEAECDERFDQLKDNEEELNRIFARIYGLEGEVPVEVPDDKVSVRRADLVRDVKSLVSYGIGCIMGRYSLDVPGLVLADQGSTLDDYYAKVPNRNGFAPCAAGIVPITEGETEWFGDDAVAQLRRWLAVAFGEATLDENVAFIERALGKSLRAYLARDFYDDHLKTYQKRPIYWLFQSPRKGFAALVYLHRYEPGTATTLLSEYIRPLREKMGAQARLPEVTGNARDVSAAAKMRATVDELDAWEHDVMFPLAQRHVALDLDDGVKKNYGRPEFKGALRKVTGLS